MSVPLPETREVIGTAACASDRWHILFAIGETVYHVADTERRPGVVVKICLRPEGAVTYCVEWGNASWNEYSAVALRTEFQPHFGAE